MKASVNTGDPLSSAVVSGRPEHLHFGFLKSRGFHGDESFSFTAVWVVHSLSQKRRGPEAFYETRSEFVVH